MARPTKQGIDYFPLDVQFDDKVELYVAETGAVGLAVLVTIWQLIYQNEGYYIKNSDDLVLLIRRRLMAEISEISSCIDAAISRGVFSSEMNDSHKILTSKAIQKRYFDAAKKKKTVNVDGNYIINGVSVGGNSVYIGGNATNVNVEVKEEVKEEVKVKEEEKNKQPEKPKKPRQKKESLMDRFEDFWNAFADKRGRDGAEKVWKRRKLDRIADDVIKGALEYVKTRGEDRHYWKQAQGWLNDGRWKDESIDLPQKQIEIVWTYDHARKIGAQNGLHPGSMESDRDYIARIKKSLEE